LSRLQRYPSIAVLALLASACGKRVTLGDLSSGITPPVSAGLGGSADQAGEPPSIVAPDAGGTTGDSTGGAAGSQAGSSSTPHPSCVGLPSTCGSSSDKDCCASSLISGGTFARSFDGLTFTDASYPATVSDFELDSYEITVGRFRRFVAVYAQDMIAAGSGKNPNDTGDLGWDPNWNQSLVKDTTTLNKALRCASIATWSDPALDAASENLPITCLDWFEAEAFCTWDGGRLPTEAEWNYAASGGAEQRAYPWSVAAAPSAIDHSNAVYGEATSLLLVGSKSPQGDGKWGQADLAGNVREWTQDWYVNPYSNPCHDCANTTTASGVVQRVVRGGEYSYESGVSLLSSTRGASEPFVHDSGTGARCARAPR
jgi:sulfatase modifying factor 1